MEWAPPRLYRILNSVLLLLGLAAAVVVLSGCMGEVTEDIWLNGGERWKVELTASLSEEERELMERGINEEDFKELAEELGEDVSFRWDKRENSGGGITYYFFIKGKGWNKLNEVSFDNNATIYKDESEHVHITWYPSSSSSFRSYTLTIHGGEIVSSNADEKTRNSATWHNPTRQIQVELTEGGSSLAPIAAIGFACVCLVALVVAGGAIVIILLRSQKPETSSTTTTQQ